MKKSLHPAAIAAAVAALVAVLGTLLVKIDGRATARSDAASPYAKVGELPKSSGSGVNSMTGEPLPDAAKAYAADSFAQYTAPKGGRRP